MSRQFKEQLAKVQWFADPCGTSVLGKIGVSYGFSGFGKQPPAAYSVKQVHGSRIVDACILKQAAKQQEDFIEADGLYLKDEGGVIAVKTADCLPIILASREKKLVMALHAGWRGLSGGIIQRALATAEELGCGRETLYAVLGPVISLQRFEVGEEVVEAFCDPSFGLSNGQIGFCLLKGQADRWHIDLSQCAVFTLLNQGISPEHVSALRSCTFDNPQLWPSYRRDGKAYPSIWTWVSLP